MRSRLTLPPPRRILLAYWAATDGQPGTAFREKRKYSEPAGNFSGGTSSNTMSSRAAQYDEADLPDEGQPKTLANNGAAKESAHDSAKDSGNGSEAELLRRARDGDRSAYGQIVIAYQDRLYNAVLRLIGDREEARDITQEAFVRGLEKLDSFRGDAGPYTWLFRIAMNLAITHLRKRQRDRTYSLDRPGSNGGDAMDGEDNQAAGLLDRVSRSQELTPEEGLHKREREQQVLEALARLDAEQRAVLVMRDVEGFDYQQMADVLSLPLGTLKSRLFRARLALRDELQAYLADARSDARRQPAS